MTRLTLWEWRALIAAFVLLAVLRIAVAQLLNLPIESDGEAYLLMAQAMAQGGPPADQYGNLAFYSIGYPLFLTPFVALFGGGIGTIVFANAILAVISGCLVFSVARAIGLRPIHASLAVGLFALWIPGLWNGAQAAKENFSTPLLLLLLLAALMLMRGGGLRWAAIAGVTYGLGLLTGGSTLLLCAIPLLAIVIGRRRDLKMALAQCGACGACAAAVLAPWLLATALALGSPVLNSNGGFNLYLGNNPAATGRFVSIPDTPAGADWEKLRAERGEIGASDVLAERAMAHILEHPLDTLLLAGKKLVLFWVPNLPDAQDFKDAPLIAQLRTLEVMQFLLLVVGGGLGLATSVSDRRGAWLCTVTIGLFWVLHAAAYIIVRYRDPIMPILLIGATALAVRLAEMLRQKRLAHDS